MLNILVFICSCSTYTCRYIRTYMYMYHTLHTNRFARTRVFNNSHSCDNVAVIILLLLLKLELQHEFVYLPSRVILIPRRPMNRPTSAVICSSVWALYCVLTRTFPVYQPYPKFETSITAPTQSAAKTRVVAQIRCERRNSAS